MPHCRYKAKTNLSWCHNTILRQTCIFVTKNTVRFWILYENACCHAHTQYKVSHWSEKSFHPLGAFPFFLFLKAESNAHRYGWRCCARSTQKWIDGQSTHALTWQGFETREFERKITWRMRVHVLQVLIRPIEESNSTSKRRCVVALVPVSVLSNSRH